MEIHKPKAVHSWREFFKEYAIIVLGVATALAAEQAVEWWHWQGEVKVARQALHDEIAGIDRFYMRRIELAPCAARQEQEAGAILDGLGSKSGAAARFSAFHHGTGTLLVDSEWQSERSAQVLTHFPRAELVAMNRYYALVPDMRSWMEAEAIVWSELSILQTSSAQLDPPQIARLRGQLDRAHRLNFLMVLNGYRMLKLSDQLGIVRPKMEPGFMNGYCRTGDERNEAKFLNAAAQP